MVCRELLRRKYKELSLSSAIFRKWRHDCLHLPLSSAHRELYDIIHRLCWRELHEFPNLVQCRDFNDRIQWLKLFDQSEDIIRCTDKVLVRDYVMELIGDEHLPNLYQLHDNFAQINFKNLPESFVIKTNHDSGTVILVRDKSKIDLRLAEEKIDKALSRTYGRLNGEWAYSHIKPKVMIEEYINPIPGPPPADYKFHCVDGRVRWLQYICDRGSSIKETIVDPSGEVAEINLDNNMAQSSKFVVPANWEEIKMIAERLAKPFKYVRVDLYCVESMVYVGELTFFPLMGCYKGEGQRKLGELLDFDRATYKPILSTTRR